MIPSGWTGLLLLAYLLGFLPWAALRSRRQVAAIESADDATREAAERALPPRRAMLFGTVFSLAMLAVLSWVVADAWHFDLLYLGPLEGRDVRDAGVALFVMLCLFELSRRIKSDEERRRAFLRRLVPRSAGEWVIALGVVLLASFAEEAAYRGLGMAALVTATGSPLISIVLLSVAFAVGHAVQGWKNACIVGGIAATMHALVLLTGTLILAMSVHAIYDLVAIAAAARYYRRVTA